MKQIMTLSPFGSPPLPWSIGELQERLPGAPISWPARSALDNRCWLSFFLFLIPFMLFYIYIYILFFTVKIVFTICEKIKKNKFVVKIIYILKILEKIIYLI